MKPVLYHPPALAPALAETAGKFANFCDLTEAAEPPRLDSGHALWLDAEGLALLMPEYRAPFRLESRELVRRTRGPSLLSRACDARPGLTVLDPFAGFGLDALELALRGCEVTAVERLTAPHLLCCDLAARAGIALEAHIGNAWDWLSGTTIRDVVYLDPMFPPRNKRALPNRGLQHLRALSDGASPIDLSHLLETARGCARRRVVLKRRRTDAVVATPHHQIKGRSVRFDIYV